MGFKWKTLLFEKSVPLSKENAGLHIISDECRSLALTFSSQSVRPTIRTLVASPGPAGLSVGSVAVSGVASSTAPTSANECMDIPCLCGFFGGGCYVCSLSCADLIHNLPVLILYLKVLSQTHHSTASLKTLKTALR